MRDHVPVVINLKYTLTVKQPADFKRWDQHEITRALKTETIKQCFLQEVEQQVAQLRKHIDLLANDPTPDAHYEALMQIIQQTAYKHFQLEKQAKDP